MDLISRVEYQKGNLDNKYGLRNFQPETALDSYIIARVESRNRIRAILDERGLENAENKIAENIVKKVDDLIKIVLPK